MSAEEIRSSIILLEQFESTNVIDEAAPMGFLKQLATKAASLIDKSKEGELETGQIANAWFGEYKKYLNKIGKNKPEEGTIADLFAFFTGTGFNLQAITSGVKKGMSVDIKNKKDLRRWGRTKHQTQEKLANTFLYIMQAQSAKPTASLKPEYWGQMGHKKVSPGKDREEPDTSGQSGPPRLSDAEIQALLQTATGSAADAGAVAALKTALKNAGLIS